MGMFQIIIRNRNFDISCADTEEEKVREMGKILSHQVAALAQSIPDASVSYLLVLAAIDLAVENADLKASLAALKDASEVADERATNAIEQATQKIDALIVAHTKNNLPD